MTQWFNLFELFYLYYILFIYTLVCVNAHVFMYFYHMHCKKLDFSLTNHLGRIGYFNMYIHMVVYNMHYAMKSKVSMI